MKIYFKHKTTGHGTSAYVRPSLWAIDNQIPGAHSFGCWSCLSPLFVTGIFGSKCTCQAGWAMSFWSCCCLHLPFPHRGMLGLQMSVCLCLGCTWALGSWAQVIRPEWQVLSCTDSSPQLATWADCWQWCKRDLMFSEKLERHGRKQRTRKKYLKWSLKLHTIIRKCLMNLNLKPICINFRKEK